MLFKYLNPLGSLRDRYAGAQSGRSSRRAVGSNEDAESECGRLVGTVRRHMPIDTRDPIGAIIHFYVGDSFDSNRAHGGAPGLIPWGAVPDGTLEILLSDYLMLGAEKNSFS